MAPDLLDVRSWVRAPEGWIIIALSTFFGATTFFNLAIVPLILPVDRAAYQVLADPRADGFEPEGGQLFCNVDGFGLIGFKFSAGPNYKGVACWNFAKSDWDIRLFRRIP